MMMAMVISNASIFSLPLLGQRVNMGKENMGQHGQIAPVEEFTTAGQIAPVEEFTTAC